MLIRPSPAAARLAQNFKLGMEFRYLLEVAFLE
jgi:hypothetical protein